MSVMLRSPARRLLFGLLPVLVLSGLSTAALAAPRERDVYYAFVADGQRYGSRHVTVTRLEDANFRYVVEERVLVDLLGAQRQELSGRTELVLTPDYRPVSLRAEGTTAAGKGTAAGSVEDGKFRVALNRGGFETVREVDLAEPVVFHCSLPDWLNEPDQKEAAGPRKLRIVDERSFAPFSGTAEQKKGTGGEVLWNVTLGPEIGQGEMVLDPDGILQEFRMHVPPMLVQRCSKEEAANIKCRVLSGREVLSFPLTRPIARPDRLTSLTVSLQWSGIPRDRLNLEDERQHVAEASDEDEKHRVVLKISPIKPVETSLEFPIDVPVDGAEFAPFLAETRFIKPADESIRVTAREWTNGSKTALDAVRGLSKGIGE